MMAGISRGFAGSFHFSFIIFPSPSIILTQEPTMPKPGFFFRKPICFSNFSGRATSSESNWATNFPRASASPRLRLYTMPPFLLLFSSFILLSLKFFNTSALPSVEASLIMINSKLVKDWDNRLLTASATYFTEL